MPGIAKRLFLINNSPPSPWMVVASLLVSWAEYFGQEEVLVLTVPFAAAGSAHFAASVLFHRFCHWHLSGALALGLVRLPVFG